MKKEQPQNAPARGFTLIELLVVTAIVAVLAAMVIPAIGRAVERARLVRCAAHLRSIHTAAILYIEDHQGMFPDAHWTRQYEQWTFFSNYLSNPQVFLCMSARRNGSAGKYWPQFYCTTINGLQFCTDYKIADNDALETLPAAAIPRPQEFVVACDIDWGLIGPHEKREQFLFLDGRIEPLTRAQSLGPDSAGKIGWYNWGLP